MEGVPSEGETGISRALRNIEILHVYVCERNRGLSERRREQNVKEKSKK